MRSNDKIILGLCSLNAQAEIDSKTHWVSGKNIALTKTKNLLLIQRRCTSSVLRKYRFIVNKHRTTYHKCFDYCSASMLSNKRAKNLTYEEETRYPLVEPK